MTTRRFLPVVVLVAVAVASCATTAEPATNSSSDRSSPTSSASSTSIPLRGDDLDGDPEGLGVASIDFVTALFPTSPEEIRVTAAWTAMRTNVELYWTEQCMAEAGFAHESPRYTAANFRRWAMMPDFETDARVGTAADQEVEAQEPAGPPPDATAAEAEAWDARYIECSANVEKHLSEGFDQVLGRMPPWYQIVEEVNNSEAMAEVTTELLDCVADNGGPEAESIQGIYLAMDNLKMNATTEDEFDAVSIEIPKIIYKCSGDFSATRQALLIPRRDALLRDYADVLAEAEAYFNEVLTASGWDD